MQKRFQSKFYSFTLSPQAGGSQRIFHQLIVDDNVKSHEEYPRRAAIFYNTRADFWHQESAAGRRELLADKKVCLAEREGTGETAGREPAASLWSNLSTVPSFSQKQKKPPRGLTRRIYGFCGWRAERHRGRSLPALN
jgi:hypothetical protein